MIREGYSYLNESKIAAAILIELVCLVTVSHAQRSNPIVDTEAERILDKAAQAEGAENVLGTLRTMRMKGVMYFGASHLLGDIESIVKFPDKFCDVFQGSNGNAVKYGFDGTEAWNRSSPGEHLAGLPKIQILLPAAQWRLRYSEARFLGQRKIEHREAYVIRALIHGQISPADYYYDPVNYLLLQVDTSASEIHFPDRVTSRVLSFHEIDGVKLPHEWSLNGNRTVITSIKLNIDIDDSQFAKPK